MNNELPRRRILRLAGAGLMLPLLAAARAGPLGDDPLKLKRPHGEQGLPRDPGYGSPTGPVRPAPGDVHPPTPSPTIWPRPEPGWRPARPTRRQKLPPRIPKPPGLTPPAS